jgi:YD repeat-containing protein
VKNSRSVRDALDQLKAIDITVPVWDSATGSGKSSAYRVAAFARVRLLTYDLAKEKRLTVRLLGYVACGAGFPTETQVTTYSYDGLLRLSGAVESSGASYAYGYDLAGNRTDVWANGSLVSHRDYDAANQVIGWQYDAAGNLLNDGTATYTYDALRRLVMVTAGDQQRANSYNGDGVLIAQTTDGITTRYTQDLAGPLSQVLQTTENGRTTSYLHGLERLGAVNGSTRMWYAADALGSMRLTMDETGAPLTSHWYDPWVRRSQGRCQPPLASPANCRILRPG